MTPTNFNPVEPKDWAEFQSSGMLFLANTVLHFFGWAIVFEIENGSVTNVYPARTSFRGFPEKVTSEGHIAVAEYLRSHAESLLEEAKS